MTETGAYEPLSVFLPGQRVRVVPEFGDEFLGTIATAFPLDRNYSTLTRNKIYSVRTDNGLEYLAYPYELRVIK